MREPERLSPPIISSDVLLGVRTTDMYPLRVKVSIIETQVVLHLVTRLWTGWGTVGEEDPGNGMKATRTVPWTCGMGVGRVCVYVCLGDSTSTDHPDRDSVRCKSFLQKDVSP